MAAFTFPSESDLKAFLAAIGIRNFKEYQSIEAGSVNSNFSVIADDKRFFLRLYEEQGEGGAKAELAMLDALARGGVRTPTAVGQGMAAGKPAALFPWVEGTMSCQRSVTVERARAVGEGLARVHVVGRALEVARGRFHVAALRDRLRTIDGRVYPVERLAAALDTFEEERVKTLPWGLVHGDLFRDNVLWSGEELAALLDFESASHGPLVYDVAVTVLAWCFGDTFDVPLARALIEGYEHVRALDGAEKRAFYTEARLAAVRFTITRITDYAMKAGPNRVGVMKDWKRFLARLDALETLGPTGVAGFVGV